MDASDIYKGGGVGADGSSPDDAAPREKKPHSGWWAVLAGMLVFWMGIVADQVTSWTDWKMGLFNGAVVGGVLAVACSLVYLVPWVAGIRALYRWRKWRRFRTLWMMAPAMLLAVAMIAGVVGKAIQGSDTRSVFRQKMKAELPANAREVRCYLFGGLLADHHDVFYFETTPEEVDRLVAGMKLGRDKLWGPGSYAGPPPEGVSWFPDLKTWDEGRRYERWDEDFRHWQLFTDKEKKRVVVAHSTI